MLGVWSDVDWGDIFDTGLKSTPTIISAVKGQAYGSTPYGPTGGLTALQQQQLGIQGSLGGLTGSLGISPTTLLLVGGLFLAVMMMRR